jgi:hypothetical protein
VFEIKENIVSLPMLYLSRQININDKENKNEQKQQSSCAYISASACKSHEKISHGPFFSTFTKRKKRWSLRVIVYQAILMAFDNSSTLKDKFQNARQCLIEMFPNRRRPGKTYQGLARAILAIPESFREKIKKHLQEQHRKSAGDSWELFGWIPFAVDGSRVEVPRTKANQQAFGCAGKDKTGPQISLTTVYHMGTALPWDWAAGPGPESERTHLRSMLSSLPAGSLLVADAGFPGFDLFREILNHKLSFLIRVGSHVSLLTGLGVDYEKDDNIVWLWPRNKRNKPPLKLRLIRLKAKSENSGNDEYVYLLTNVLDSQLLSDEAAGRFYEMRWGVEVFYRSFKQTFSKRKLLSCSPYLAMAELYWSLIALLLLGLMGVDSLVQNHTSPACLSVASCLRVVRHAMRSNCFIRHSGGICVKLRCAVKDKYVRHSDKKARDWAFKKRKAPPGPPKIRPAKSNEIACAKRFYDAA